LDQREEEKKQKIICGFDFYANVRGHHGAPNMTTE